MTALVHAIGEMSIDLVELFEQLGINTVGDLAALDQRDVLGRFGLPGVRAYRVATGADERLSSITPSQLPERERRFDEPFLRSHRWYRPRTGPRTGTRTFD